MFWEECKKSVKKLLELESLLFTIPEKERERDRYRYGTVLYCTVPFQYSWVQTYLIPSHFYIPILQKGKNVTVPYRYRTDTGKKKRYGKRKSIRKNARENKYVVDKYCCKRTNSKILPGNSCLVRYGMQRLVSKEEKLEENKSTIIYLKKYT